MKSKLSEKMLTLISYTTLSLFSAFCIYPLLLTLMVSISDENKVQLHGYKLIPEKISFATYIYLWDKSASNFLYAYTITILVTVLGTLLSMIVTSMLAFTISEKSVRFRNAISLFAYFTVICSAGIVPWYVVCVAILHINNTLTALLFPYIVNVWNLFLLRTYFQSIPDSLKESAKIDGANDFYIFCRIVIPLSKTAVITVALFYALQYWNDWWLSIMLVTKSSLFPLQYYLFSILTNVQALASNSNLSSHANIALPTDSKNGSYHCLNRTHHITVSICSEIFCQRYPGWCSKGMNGQDCLKPGNNTT